MEKYENNLVEKILDEMNLNSSFSFVNKNILHKITSQLIKMNAPRLINKALKYQDTFSYSKEDILRELGSWQAGKKRSFTFLGIRVTTSCNVYPRCSYCTQDVLPQKMQLKDWKRIIDEVTEGGKKEGVILSISGGEPLLLGEEIWGDNGLVKFAAERKMRVGLNTNGHFFTREVANKLIENGIHRVYFGVDGIDPTIHGKLRGAGNLQKVLRAIKILEEARLNHKELDIKTKHHMHICINMVITNLNFRSFPEVLRYFLNMHRPDEEPFNIYNLLPNVIPVKPPENSQLFLTQNQLKEFDEKIWENVEKVWHNFKVELTTNPSFKARDEKWLRQSFLEFYPFDHFIKRNEYGNRKLFFESAENGNYNPIKPKQCYQCGTSAYVLPNGEVHPCAGKAEFRRHPNNVPLGFATDPKSSLLSIMDDKIDYLNKAPHGSGCNLCQSNTVCLNFEIERYLNDFIRRLERIVMAENNMGSSFW